MKHPNKSERWPVVGAVLLILVFLVAGRFVTASQLSSETPTGTPSVTSSTNPPPFQPEELEYAQKTTWRFPDDPQIEAMRGNIVHTFQLCELEFVGRDGQEVWGFMPGAEYPMIFVRDAATMMPTLLYFYPDERLRTPIEEFLRRQYGPETTSDEDGYAAGEGAVSAVVAPDHHVDKATAVSDEETSLIHAAYVYWRAVGGEEWLRQEINGQPVIDRLNAALEWLYAHRYDENYGLIRRAHTTDWGDVKMEQTDGNPTDFDPATDHWTCSIYDQALTYRALLELAEMNQALDYVERAESLRARAADLRQWVNAHLWQPQRGFYRIHLHLTPLRHPFDEDAIISIGNAVAVRCGLADGLQIRSIFGHLEAARRKAGAKKPGLALYPPYPEGTFAQVQMGEGRYQNGGLWDWWGGAQIAAEFENGQAGQALFHLQQVAEDWAAHPTEIYEWQEPTSGFGHGPANYAGAAGRIGEAIIRGFYGLDLERRGVVLGPRLGKHPGYVRVYQPATDRYAAYNYAYLGERVVLDYGTNHPGPLTVKALLPAGSEVERAEIDGQETSYTIERVGEEAYCVLSAPVGIHRAVITFVS